jgi:hypothetical protein
MSRDIHVTADERKLLMELAIRDTKPLLAPEGVVMSLMKKGLIGFGLTNRGDQFTQDLKKRDVRR